jgi:hypothetical protein
MKSREHRVFSPLPLAGEGAERSEAGGGACVRTHKACFFLTPSLTLPRKREREYKGSGLT